MKRCHPLLTVGVIAVSNPRPQLVTDATHFAWLCLFQFRFYRLMSRYSEYLLGIPTLSGLYSKEDCHGRNISELEN